MSASGETSGHKEPNQLSYEELVNQIRSGNAQAELSMVTRFAPGLKTMLNRKCSPDIAEDVFQETWRVAIEKVRKGDLRQPDRLPAFIHQIARNQVVMYYRKNSDTQETPDDNDLVAPGPSPEQALETRRIQDHVRGMIEQLDTPRDREILKRYYVLEEDKEQICEDLNLSSQHFNRVIYRAKTRMRSFFVKDNTVNVK
ncbi:RNA polymerase sigma factor [Halioxenophilus aromaticivorans]|uniref:RNA polymerase sigma-70 region 2 domain-containing protein n=1 Tax=Halioxenophilus aromaticivorans TaxID=1306992 RepID=A0AAV3U4X0_9ALTE